MNERTNEWVGFEFVVWDCDHSLILLWLNFFFFFLPLFILVAFKESGDTNVRFAHLSGREPSNFPDEEARVQKGWVTCPLVKDRDWASIQVSQLWQLLSAKCFISSFLYRKMTTNSFFLISLLLNSEIPSFGMAFPCPACLVGMVLMSQNFIHSGAGVEHWFSLWTSGNTLCLHLFWGWSVQLNPSNII